MFEMFDQVYQYELEQFLAARNANLLILYKSKMGKDQRIVQNLAEIKILECENLPTIQAISCLAGFTT